MTLAQTLPSAAAELRLSRPAELVCFALCVANVSYLAGSVIQGGIFTDPGVGHDAVDFVNFWSTGREVLDGHPTAPYDTDLHKAAQVAALGHPFQGFFPWFYPPTFLFVAAALALVPYTAAFAGWVTLTFLCYVAAIRRIVGDRIGIFLACAFPGVVSDFIIGQNGFLTAALLGGSLGLMERRPVAAGCLLGLMTYKPQFGILFPLVLVVGGCWRVIAAAAATTLALAALSWLAFGAEVWQAFFQYMAVASRVHLGEGVSDFAKLQSVFTLVRWLGGSEALGWAVHLPIVAAGALALCWLWRSRLAFDLKAAGLAVGALLATPYLFLYDLVALAVPMAFIYRATRRTGALPHEMAGLGLACALVFIFPLVKAPVGLVAAIIVAGLIVRRCRLEAAGQAQPAV
jgi:arabinofuranan 3-O-arabinosyltransferase